VPPYTQALVFMLLTAMGYEALKAPGNLDFGPYFLALAPSDYEIRLGRLELLSKQKEAKWEHCPDLGKDERHLFQYR
jgi:hypothetical protein